MDAHTIRLGLIEKENRIVVRIYLLITMEYIASPSVDILLQTDNVCILLCEIAENRIETFTILKVVNPRIGTDIVRQ